MWKDILYFEIQQGFKKVSVWVYFIIFFALAFLIANILGGAFTGASIVIGNQGTNVNSPLLIAELQTVFTIFGVLICAAIFGNAGYRDYETNMHPLIFTMFSTLPSSSSQFGKLSTKATRAAVFPSFVPSVS